MPGSGDLAEIVDFVAVLDAKGIAVPRLSPALVDADGHRVEIPSPVYEALRQVVTAMASGQGVTIAPHNTMLTTQEAADFLGISRPTLVRLITDGLIPHEMRVARRVMLADCRLPGTSAWTAERHSRRWCARASAACTTRPHPSRPIERRNLPVLRSPVCDLGRALAGYRRAWSPRARASVTAHRSAGYSSTHAAAAPLAVVAPLGSRRPRWAAFRRAIRLTEASEAARTRQAGAAGTTKRYGLSSF
jgi:excisionase family DNA binding protein